MTTPEPHPSLGWLTGLIGTFEGEGEGHYPTIEPFRYRERITFGHDGRPFLSYEQVTWRRDGSAPMHREVGFLRVVGEGEVEFVLAHAFGIAEVQVGTARDGVAALVSTALPATPTARTVRSVRRRFELVDATLRTDLWMAYGDVPDTHHLASTLERVG